MSNYYIHASSFFDKDVSIGNNTKIWHFCHVCKNATIGKNVSIGQNVYVGENVIIGDDCKIQNNVSIFTGVSIEDQVFCGPSVVFTNVYNPRSNINRKKEFKKTLVRKGVTLGANCTIVCGIEIGKYAFIGAGSVVREDVLEYALVVGNPGRQIGWMSEYGEKLPLPLYGVGQYKCPNTKITYNLKKNKITTFK